MPVAEDERFATDGARTSNRELLRQVIEDGTGAREVSAVLAAARSAGVPAGPVWDLAEALDSDQIKERDLVGELDHPDLGALRYLRQPVRLQDSGTGARPGTPVLGEHRDAVRHEWLAE